MGSSMSGLEQRSYIVTGAGGSIGRAAALILARRGANVVVADIVEAAAEETVRLIRSEEHTSELQSLMRISYAVFCLKKKKTQISQSQTKHRYNQKTKTRKIIKKHHKHTSN